MPYGAIIGAMLLVHGAVALEPPPAAVTSGQSTPDKGSSDTPTITVEGRREHIESEVSSFVASVAVNPWDEPLARWQPAVCLMVIGLPRDRGTAVFRRIAQIAKESGVPLDKPDCSAKLVILVTPDPETSLQKLWSSNPRLFNEDRGVGGITHFIHSSEPVRAWHNVCSEAPMYAKDLGRGPWCNTGAIGSLLSFESIRAIYAAIVVVDVERTKGLSDTQLAGYAAMLALVQTRDNRVPSMPTILSLFTEPDSQRPQDLSVWDKAFLKALYSVDPSEVTQVQQIQQKMERELAP